MSPNADQLKSEIAAYKLKIKLVQAQMDRKIEEHEETMKRVKNSKKQAVILEKQLDRAIESMVDEPRALGEKIDKLGEALEALVGETGEGS